MAEPEDDVLGKLDALLKRHQPPDPDIPVLTEVLVPPALDLDAIPILTEEITTGEPATPPCLAEGLPASGIDSKAADARQASPPPATGPSAAEDTGQEAPAPPAALLEFDLPPEARYIALDAAPTAAPAPPAAPAVPPAGQPDGGSPVLVPALHALSEDTIQLITDTIKADVAKILDAQLQQALAKQLQSTLHVALDRALSSMLDQFVIHIEEVVKISIASELEKRLTEPHRRDA